MIIDKTSDITVEIAAPLIPNAGIPNFPYINMKLNMKFVKRLITLTNRADTTFPVLLTTVIIGMINEKLKLVNIIIER